jgi:hypothetical protein
VYNEFRSTTRRLGSQRKALDVCMNNWARKAPTTRVGYIKSLKKLACHYGHVRLPRNWGFLALRGAKLAAASHRPKRAQVLTSENLRALLLSKAISRRTRLLAAMTFLSASRYDDLTRKETRCKVITKDMMMIRLPVDKGNPFGRVARKFIHARKLINKFNLPVGKTLQVRVPYKDFLRAVKLITPKWTGHSGRRTATTVLSRKGFTLREIQNLTLHSGLEARSLQSTRQYVDASKNSPESRAQTRMSQVLSRWAGW